MKRQDRRRSDRGPPEMQIIRYMHFPGHGHCVVNTQKWKMDQTSRTILSWLTHTCGHISQAVGIHRVHKTVNAFEQELIVQLVSAQLTHMIAGIRVLLIVITKITYTTFQR